MAIRNKKTKKSIFRSGYEESVSADLLRHKIPHGYETTALNYEIPATQHTYTPDIFLENGIICELKGYMDIEVRKKMLYVIRQNPELDIRMVFQNPNLKITKGSKTTYAVWATKNKIRWGTETDIILWAREKPKTK